MGKKSKKSRSSSNKNGASVPLPRRSAIPQCSLQKALAECSFDRLRDVYTHEGMEFMKAMTTMRTHKNAVKTPVSKAEMKNATAATRVKMEQHLGNVLTEGPLNKVYCRRMHEHLRSLGRGMKIVSVAAVGKQSSSVYTVGFASIGGKELLLQDIHRSMGHSGISTFFNHLYDRHKQGYPLGHGHTAQGGGGVGYVVSAPESPVEATLLKATKMLEATRLYGVAGFDILLLTPVGVTTQKEKEEDDDDDGVTAADDATGRAETTTDANDDSSPSPQPQPKMTREDVLCMAMGMDDKDKGFKTLGGKAKKLEACAWCHQVRDTTKQERLMRCGGCQYAFYCCREHQKLDWKKHRETCLGRGFDENARQKSQEPFAKELQAFEGLFRE